jgi:CheY-like chemotaxis protein
MSKILIVDDDPDFLNATRILLEHEGHQVKSATGGKQGFEEALENDPDLVILDVMMESVLEGVSVTHKMHANPVTCNIPIMMVSAIAHTDYAALFPTDEYLYIDAYLNKPVDPTMLIKKVRRVLA